MKIFITSFVLMMVMAVTYEARNVSLISHIVILGSARGFAKASNDFGFHLLQQIQHHSSGSENVFFSPYSVAVALSMVYQGTQGYTAEQFKRALNYDKISQLNNGEYQAVANSVKRLRERMNKAKHIILEYGNMLVVDNKKPPIKDEYRKTIEQYYDSQVMSVDFAKESNNIMEQINQYISNKTHGLIDRMLEQPPSPSTVLALINAVYFKGEWLEQFDPKLTKPGVFYDHRGQEYKNVQYMNGDGPFGHVEVKQLNSDLIKMPYKGKDVAFYGLLPRERNCDLSKIRQSLNSSFINEMISRIAGYSTVYFPKIKLATSYELPKILKSMCIQDVFTNLADLSGISGDKSLKIDKAIHKAKLIVNEQGTEAAASTYIQIGVKSAGLSKTFRFDHPFLYFIRHRKTGQILFLGEIHNF
ncbi:iripin-3-like [Dermatophagoides pteronyssinus]|uniref:iripin-3-like n=1 Tax=Dermatophagoides pteronyssinus TaxID=6956 RepID=UPI003F676038